MPMIAHDMMDAVAGLPTPRRLRMFASFDLLTAAGVESQILEFDQLDDAYRFTVMIENKKISTSRWPVPDAAVRAVAEVVFAHSTCEFCDRPVAFDYLTATHDLCNYYFAIGDDGYGHYYPECQVASLKDEEF